MRTIICSVLLVVACLACGCSSRGKVNGKIVKDGQPFPLSEKGLFVLSFVSADGNDKTIYNASTKPDGTFTILGPEGKGIPSGKYKVVLTAMDPYDKQVDKLGGKYAQAASTPMTVDVGKGELVIDVGK